MANSHGIGVKRNDYHRKNRKENKGWRWRFSKGGVSASMLDRLALLKITIPRLSDDELIQQASSIHRGQGEFATSPMRNRVCVDYLKHYVSGYESLIRLARKNHDYDAYLLISKKVFDAISLAFPWLADECATQYAERTDERPEPVEPLRLIKRSESVTSLRIAEANAIESAEFSGIIEEDEIPGYLGEVDISEDAKDPRSSTLNPEHFMYLPPFLKKDEVERRRFAGAESSDRWWEWEDESGQTKAIRALNGNPL